MGGLGIDWYIIIVISRASRARALNEVQLVK